MSLNSINLRPTSLLEAHRTIAALVAVNDRLRELAFTDQLTELMNREPVLDRLNGELRSFSERRKPHRGVESLAIVALDLVGFKTINNRFGHDEGDAALVHTAQALKNAVRKNDLVARWGGDEFVVVLWNVDELSAAHVVERIANGIRAFRRPLDSRIGCVVWERSDGPCSPHELIKAADELERELKGKNAPGVMLTRYRHP